MTATGENASRFRDLLYDGISAIHTHESLEKRKTRKAIQQELAEAVGRKESTIEWYLKGEGVPGTLREVEQLAKEIVRRGKLERKWVEEFLRSAGHPSPEQMCKELLSPTSALRSVGPTEDKIVSGHYERRAHRNRLVLLAKVKTFWIKGMLEQSLYGAALLELGLEDRWYMSGYPWDVVIQKPNQPTTPRPSGTTVIDVFEEMNQSLVILGEPGSGKTTMLLEIARVTIAQAEKDPSRPIPVVFNLSSWAVKRPRFDQWLVEDLVTMYQMPTQVAQAWVKEDELLLLLDGLDEVAKEHRGRCVEEMNRFLQERNTAILPMVICSRTQEFDVLTIRLRMEGIVTLQPLTAQQVEDFLARAGDKLDTVRNVLQRDSTLQELIQSPLMLSILAMAYQNISSAELPSFYSLEAHRRHLFNTYIERMLQFRKRTRVEQYSHSQTVHWLAWLAKQMIGHSEAVFYIDQMQPDWLQTRRNLYRTSIGLTVALPVGLSIGLTTEPHVGLIAGVMAGVFSGLCAMRNIMPLKYGTWRRVIITLWNTPYFSFRLILLLLLCLLAQLVFGMGLWLLAVATVGIMFMLWVALTVNLGEDTQLNVVPAQGIRQSFISALMVGLAVALAGSAISLNSAPVNMINTGLMYGLMAGLLAGGFACVQHIMLRLLLLIDNHIPWNYASFLNYASEHLFLRKIGSGYIFIHRLLMEHFVDMVNGMPPSKNNGVAIHSKGSISK